MGHKKEVIGAHRKAWELFNGVIPKGMHVLHKCDNPACVNPAHLFLGTNADNVNDKVIKGRQPSSINDDVVTAIIQAFDEGLSQTKIAALYGMSQSHVSRLVRGERIGITRQNLLTALRG
jgi:predicted XRE-type DNA-binding protein